MLGAIVGRTAQEKEKRLVLVRNDGAYVLVICDLHLRSKKKLQISVKKVLKNSRFKIIVVSLQRIKGMRC